MTTDKAEDRPVAYASAPYAPVHGDELALQLGDKVTIMHEYDDGWVLAKNDTRGGSIGLAPGNFLQSAPPSSSAAKAAAPDRVASLVVRDRRTSHLIDPRKVDGRNPLATTDRPAPKVLSLQDAKKKLADIETARKSRARNISDVGAVKIMVQGDSGIGKTSLIHELLRMPEIYAAEPKPPSKASSIAIEPTPFALLEYHASTVPSPALRIAEDRLNLTIIDTPGYGSVLDALTIIRPVVSYHVSQFQRTDLIFTREATPTQLVRFLSASTGAHSHVDVALYCMFHRCTGVDVEYMRRLAKVVCVVPVVIRSDAMTRDEAFAAKKAVIETLVKAGVEFYGFGLTKDEMIVLAEGKVAGAPPYVVSSKAYTPGDKSDASLTEGKKPLNEFAYMKDAILLLHIDEMRRQSADRFVRWRSAGAPKDVE